MKKPVAMLVIIIAVGGLGVLIGSAWFAKKKRNDILKQFNEANTALDSINRKSDSLNERTGAFAALSRELYYSIMTQQGITADEAIKLQQLKNGMDTYLAYVDSLRKAFRLTFTNEADFKATEKFFIKDGNGKNLFGRMIDLKILFQEVAVTDSIKQQLSKTLAPGIEANIRNVGMFIEKYFRQTPAVSTLTILAFFQKDAEGCELDILKDYSNLAALRKSK